MTQKNIVFEDDAIRVIEQQGQSECLVISFGDRVNLADADHFYAEKPLSKFQFSCIGFMAKKPNWFPKESMQRAYQAIEPILARYQQIILYGGSMGGYAALKYSKLLHATQVISFIPQWSIVPEECAKVDVRYTPHFTENLRDMSINAEDIQGAVYVFYDPYFYADTFHVEKIKAVYPQLHPVFVRFCKHDITAICAKSELFLNLIESSLSHDLERMYIHIAKQRRSSPYRVKGLLQYAIAQHPDYVLSLLARLSTDALKELAFYRSEALLLISTLAQRQSDIQPVMQRLQHLLSQQQRLDFQGKARCQQQPKCLLQNHHGAFLGYDIIHQRLLFTSLEVLKHNPTMVEVSIEGNYGVLSLPHGHSTRPIKFPDNPQIHNKKLNPFVLYQNMGEYFVLINHEAYCTANRNGSLSFQVQHIKAWEQLKVYPIQP